jgi:hypothetical protein
LYWEQSATSKRRRYGLWQKNGALSHIASRSQQHDSERQCRCAAKSRKALLRRQRLAATVDEINGPGSR